eukprot:TRINITY_DN6416_c0_g1_i1.p1 TRINITY_DN6416_c0_g1~~TRINITY_DN6416_c0_g1_i1.p1  ORF type:complete len:491 (+),score=93.79 TRINITY_DN6416_c0_g1_i1:15-1487(+)
MSTLLTKNICPCSAHHNLPYYWRSMNAIHQRWAKNGGKPSVRLPSRHQRVYATAQNADELHEYAFEMAASSIRYGKGVTREVGYDLRELNATKVAVFADPNIAKQPDNSPVNVVLQALHDAGLAYEVFSDIMIEPTDSSLRAAIEFAQKGNFNAFVAVGGGSTMDTAKAANLYSSYPPEDFFDYVNPPLGKGLPPPGPLKPLIAIPTTAGTGSETTGVAIFDWEEKGFKTGIAHRLLKPTLGIVDPNNTRTCPPNVIAASGFDVLCHSLESYTALPFSLRTPRPETPKLRPAYQGSNPISDFWSLKALEMTSKYIVRAYSDPEDEEARSQMILAATYAGIGFGNAGVHLCHGMSYPIAGGAHKLDFLPEGYPAGRSMVPHGMSVILNAPAVFEWTAEACPHRHLHAAQVMGADTTNVADADAGKVLVQKILELMYALNIPNGLKAIGYTEADIPNLVQGTLPQHRVTKLSPRPVDEEALTQLFTRTMSIY